MPRHYTTKYGIPKSSGIYRIICSTSGKLYIGSAVNLRKRREDHFTHLRAKTHYNQKLQRAFDKYGEQAFTFETIELVLAPFLIEREQYWLDKLKPFGKKGFNIALVAGSWYGMSHSPETCEKLRNRIVGPATREKVRIARLGSTASPETRKRMIEAHTGSKRSAQTKAKMGIAQLGHPVKPETRAKLSAANASNMKTLIVTLPDGTEQVIHGIRSFCKEHHLDYSSFMRVAKGKCKQHKGYKARFPD